MRWAAVLVVVGGVLGGAPSQGASASPGEQGHLAQVSARVGAYVERGGFFPVFVRDLPDGELLTGAIEAARGGLGDVHEGDNAAFAEYRVLDGVSTRAAVYVGERARLRVMPTEWTHTLEIVANPGDVGAVAFLGGRVLAAGIDGRVRVVCPETRRVPWTTEPIAGGVVALAGAEDGARFLTAGRREVALWDAATRRRLRVFPASVKMQGSVAISADGGVLAFRARGFAASVWNADTGQEIASFPETRRTAGGVALSRDGALLAAAKADGTVGIWEIAGGERRCLLSGHEGRVRAAVFTADGERIVTGSDDGTIRVWDAETGREIRALTGHEARVTMLSLARDDGRLLSRAPDGTVRLWDFTTGTPVHIHRSEWGARSAALGPAGDPVAFGVAGYRAGLWIGGATSDEPYAPFDGRADSVRRLALTHDGSLLVSGRGYAGAGGAHVWSVDDGSPLPTGRDGPVVAWLTSDPRTYVAVGPTGEYELGSAVGDTAVEWPSRSSVVRFWEELETAGEAPTVYLVTELGVIRRGKTAPTAAEWAALERGKDDALQVRPAWWKGRDADGVARPAGWEPPAYRGAMLTRDADGALEVRDIASGITLHTFQGASDGAAALSGDGATMASTSPGGTIYIWRLGVVRDAAGVP